MWSDRKQQDSPAIPPSAQRRPESPAPTASFETGARANALETRATALIGKAMVIKGQVRSGQHMHVAGEIDGSLSLPGYDLTVTSDAIVRANVSAREVDISGTIYGNVDATRKISVRKGGKLIGDLRTPGIVIEDGAYFKGSIEIVTREPHPIAEETAPAVLSQTTGANA